jgi:hypothetical protein
MERNAAFEAICDVHSSFFITAGVVPLPFVHLPGLLDAHAGECWLPALCTGTSTPAGLQRWPNQSMGGGGLGGGGQAGGACKKKIRKKLRAALGGPVIQHNQHPVAPPHK